MTYITIILLSLFSGSIIFLFSCAYQCPTDFDRQSDDLAQEDYLCEYVKTFKR